MSDDKTMSVFTREKKICNWGIGPWCEEFDRVDFESHGLPCIIVRNAKLGHLCGYVGVGPTHPLHGHDACDIEATIEDICVHGGLTYSRPCEEKCDDLTFRPVELLICHVPKHGQTDDVWWLGFDAAHHGDFVPGHFVRDIAEGYSPKTDGTYRTVAYMKSQCEQLAARLMSDDMGGVAR